MFQSKDQVFGLPQRFNEISDRIKQTAGKLEDRWKGDAAGAAKRGAGPAGVAPPRDTLSTTTTPSKTKPAPPSSNWSRYPTRMVVSSWCRPATRADSTEPDHPRLCSRTPRRLAQPARNRRPRRRLPGLRPCHRPGHHRTTRIPTPPAELAAAATPHDMRHTYASLLFQDGIRFDAFSALHGHKDIRTTQRYAHLADSHWEEVRSVLDEGEQREPGEDQASDGLAVGQQIARLAEEKPAQRAAITQALEDPSAMGGEGQTLPPICHPATRRCPSPRCSAWTVSAR
ncbi:tyrosine-type recombinase/integrase [Sciscionella marina]|uniref:tyrosine-type recombinase/integrase n=1 Tax=Sciscionella marina TaxID=508770 RepID=UPI000A30F09C